MSSVHDEDVINSALRDGLRRVAMPTPSADFDSCVLARLRQPRSWWQNLWDSGRPILAGAACSCIVMLAAVQWTAHGPITSPHPFIAPNAIARPLDMAAVDRLLDNSDLSAVSLWEMTTPDSPTVAPSPRRISSPKRRASRIYTPLAA